MSRYSFSLKALETTTAGSLVESSVLRPLPSAPAPSIASILRLHPGFSSRKIDQAVATPPGGESSGWRVSRSQFSDSLSLTGRAERANGILRMPKSAMGIGFGENERLKHARFQISPQVIMDIRPRKYLPPARRGSVAGEEVDRKERRNSLNDSTHRRMLADSLSTNQQTRPAKAGTTVPVKFPETTVIGPGRLPTFEEQKLIRLARGTAIATVKTVIARPADGNREKHSTGLSRSLLSIEREARREEDRKDASSEPKGSALPVTSTANLLAEGKPVPRTDSTYNTTICYESFESHLAYIRSAYSQLSYANFITHLASSARQALAGLFTRLIAQPSFLPLLKIRMRKWHQRPLVSSEIPKKMRMQIL